MYNYPLYISIFTVYIFITVPFTIAESDGINQYTVYYKHSSQACDIWHNNDTHFMAWLHCLNLLIAFIWATMLPGIQYILIDVSFGNICLLWIFKGYIHFRLQMELDRFKPSTSSLLKERCSKHTIMLITFWSVCDLPVNDIHVYWCARSRRAGDGGGDHSVYLFSSNDTIFLPNTLVFMLLKNKPHFSKMWIHPSSALSFISALQPQHFLVVKNSKWATVSILPQTLRIYIVCVT